MATLNEDKVLELRGKKLCVACGQKLTSANYQSNGMDVYKCSESGMFPWYCPECGYAFHLTESYPTSSLVTCSKCGYDTILNQHLL